MVFGCYFYIDQVSKKTISDKNQSILYSYHSCCFFSSFAEKCKSENTLVETSEHGTMICVETHCGNPKCLQRESVWQSQPHIEGTKTAAGNILLSFAILMAGASASKVLRVFSHMGMACHSLRQFYRHQKVRSNSETGITYKSSF